MIFIEYHNYIFNNNNFVIDNKYSEVIIYDFELNKFKKMFNDKFQKENIKTVTQGSSHIFKDGALMVEEAGGIVNDLNKFSLNNIDIKAASAAINDKMLENIKNF